MSIAEKLITITNNQQEVYDFGKFEVLDESEYMHPTVNSSVVSVNDVNAMEHKLGVRVKSKNLCNKEYLEDINNWSKLNANYYHIPIYVGKGNTKIAVSYSNVLETGLGLFVGIKTLDDTASEAGLTYLYHNTNSSLIRNTAILKIAEDAEYAYIRLNMTTANYGQISKFMEYIGNDLQIEIGDTISDYTPYITDFSGVEVSRYGKNLFDIEGTLQKYIDGDYETSGSYSVVTVPLKPNTKYIVKVNGEKTGQPAFISSIKAVNSDVAKGIAIYPNEHWTALEKVLTTDETGNLYFGVYPINLESRYEQLNLAKVQIELGETATDYEPYQEQTATANEDGTVERLSSLSPNMVLMTDAEGVIINCEYYRDIDTYINNLTTNIALSGGE